MSTSSPPPLPPNPIAARNRRDRKIIAIVVTPVAILTLGFCTLIYLRLVGRLRPFTVPTGAMSPAIQPGDHVMMRRLTSRDSHPQRGDIVVFKTDHVRGLTPNEIYVMRLVGLPGDRLSLVDGTLHIDKQPATFRNAAGEIHYVTIPGSRYLTYDPDTFAVETFVVPEGQGFVLGDNSAHSNDSRYWGTVPLDNILGRATSCYWPPQHIGSIK